MLDRIRLDRPAIRPLLLALSATVALGLSACDRTPEVPTAPSPSTAADSASPLPTAPPAEVGPPIRYVLGFDGAAQHYVDVEAIFDSGLASPVGRLELMMAVWTPGSYLVREYSRHVEGVEAHTLDRRPLPVIKSAKNRWIVQAEAGQDVVVRYRLYAREMSVRTNFVDVDMAVLNGAPTFLTPVGADAEPRLVSLRLPARWGQTATALDPHPSGQAHLYRADDFDTLVDSPILAGNLEIGQFEVEGVPHYLVNVGDLRFVDREQQLADVEALTRAQVEFWGNVPYEHYWFLNVISEGRGGLEHSESTLVMASRWRFGQQESYRRWLGLMSHELFHAWNVKRLRPAALGPFDYESERYTRSLWVAEGLTSYYTDLLLLRAGLLDEEDVLEDLSGTIESVQARPGRQIRSLADASFDAWIKHYRPDENSINTVISYYGKGQLVGFLLDAEIRRQTDGRRSLDEVMRLAYERYSGEVGFTPGDFRQVVDEVAGTSLAEFFDSFVDGTEELDYERALDWYGLRFAPTEGSAATESGATENSSDPKKETEPDAGWLGLRHESRGERLVVTSVLRDGPAWKGGIDVDDEILAIDGYRVLADELDDRLEYFPPGSEVEILVARRGALRSLRMELDEAPRDEYEIEIDPDAPDDRSARRRAWLRGEP